MGSTDVHHGLLYVCAPRAARQAVLCACARCWIGGAGARGSHPAHLNAAGAQGSHPAHLNAAEGQQQTAGVCFAFDGGDGHARHVLIGCQRLGPVVLQHVHRFGSRGGPQGRWACMCEAYCSWGLLLGSGGS